MQQSLDTSPQTVAQAQSVEYEQPLTERMRIFLRLEFLIHQARFHAQRSSDWDTRAAVASLLDMLAIMHRGDVRAELLRELERQAELLRGYRNQPRVDAAQCDKLLANIDRLREGLSSSGPTRLQALRDSAFLSAVKHRSAIPGGTCVFDLPEYTFWLSRPYEERHRQLAQWLELLDPLFDSLNEVLWLVRNTTRPQEKTASQGMYQQALDRNEPAVLLRVVMPPDMPVFPEISGGQKRFTVRFLRWSSPGERPQQTDEDVRFQLALC